MFDQSSGQVFKEWTVPRHSLSAQSDANWPGRRPYPLFTPRGAQGPRSLVDMAVNVIANNIGDAKYEYFEGMPIRMIWRIWRFLEARGVCLNAWKIFSKLLLQEDDEKTLGLFRSRQHICRPDQELKRYMQPLTAPATEFITHLVISGGCEFSVNEMLHLTDIKNLAILELIQPADELRSTFPEITDRLLRGWSQMDDPFPFLRILRIWGDRSTTQNSFRWVSKFPSLALYDVTGSREDWKDPYELASAEGWETHTADTTPGVENSLLRYLMMFAPLEAARTNRLRELARSIDSDLVSLCSDSRCAIKFVADKQAPALVDYLNDTAKVHVPSWDPDAASREARACHGIAFEAWAFWIYAFIGQLSNDDDLKRRGVASDYQAVVGPFVIPSKPMVCLFLGHSGRGGISSKPSYVSRGLFGTKSFAFTRSSVVNGLGPPKPTPAPAVIPGQMAPERSNPGLMMKRQKRKRLDDILQSLS